MNFLFPELNCVAVRPTLLRKEGYVTSFLGKRFCAMEVIQVILLKYERETRGNLTKYILF